MDLHEFTTIDEVGDEDDIDMEDDSDYYKTEPLAQGLINAVENIPLVGLQYILEVQKCYNASVESCSYICGLCTKKMSSATLIAHVKSVPHRLKYSECHSKEIHNKFGKMEVKQWTPAAVKEFTAAILNLDKRTGQQKMATVKESKMTKAIAHFKDKVTNILQTGPEEVDKLDNKSNDTQKKLDMAVKQNKEEPRSKTDFPPFPSVKGLSERTKLPGDSIRPPLISSPFNQSPKLRSERRDAAPRDQSGLEFNGKDKGSLRPSERQEKEQSKPVGRTRDGNVDRSKENVRKEGRRSPGKRTPPGFGNNIKRARSKSPVQRGEKIRSPPRRGNIARSSAQRGVKPGSPVSRGIKSRSPVRRRNKSRSPLRRRSRSRSPLRTGQRQHEDNLRGFRLEESRLKAQHEKEMDNYMNDPESHPHYKSEWTKFWEKRNFELKSQGREPRYYDFRAEWIPFWKKRMQELCDLEFQKRRENLLVKYQISKLGVPAIDNREQGIEVPHALERVQRGVPHALERVQRGSPRALERDQRGGPHALERDQRGGPRALEREQRGGPHALEREQRGGPHPLEREQRGGTFERSRDMKTNINIARNERSSDMLKMEAQSQREKGFYDIEFSVVGTLKLLTDLEDQLGSLVNAAKELLKKAVDVTGMGKKPVELFEDGNNTSLLKLACAKLKTQINSGFLGAVDSARTKMAIASTDWLLNEAEKSVSVKSHNIPSTHMLGLDLNFISTATVGMNDVEIAQYIAQQLLNTGKSDATEKELQDILAAVSATHLKIQMQHKATRVDPNLNMHYGNYGNGRFNALASQTVHGNVWNSNLSFQKSSTPEQQQAFQQRTTITSQNSSSRSGVPKPVPPPVVHLDRQSHAQRISDTRAPASHPSSVTALFPSGIPTSSVGSDNKSTSRCEEMEEPVPKSGPEESEEPGPKSGLSLLQSAYEEKTKDMDKLSLMDLQKMLSNFRQLNSQDQQALTEYLKKLEATDSKKVTKLRSLMHQSSKNAPKGYRTEEVTGKLRTNQDPGRSTSDHSLMQFGKADRYMSREAASAGPQRQPSENVSHGESFTKVRSEMTSGSFQESHGSNSYSTANPAYHQSSWVQSGRPREWPSSANSQSFQGHGNFRDAPKPTDSPPVFQNLPMGSPRKFPNSSNVYSRDHEDLRGDAFSSSNVRSSQFVSESFRDFNTNLSFDEGRGSSLNTNSQRIGEANSFAPHNQSTFRGGVMPPPSNTMNRYSDPPFQSRAARPMQAGFTSTSFMDN